MNNRHAILAGVMGLLLVGLAAGTANAAPGDTEPGSLAWFREVWQEASDWSPPTGLKVQYESVDRYTVDEDEVASLIAVGAADESHPAHSRLSHLLLWQQNPEFPATISVTLLPGGWRIDRDRLSDALEPGERWETVAEGESRWELSPGRLLVTDKSEPLEHFGFDNEVASLSRELREHAWFGMGFMAGSAWALSPLSSQVEPDGSWEGVVASRDGKVHKKFVGRIDPDTGLTVTSAEIVRAVDEYAYALGQSWHFSMPSPMGLLGVDRGALRVVWNSSAGGIEMERVLVGLSSIPEERQDPSILRAPVDGYDPIRGEVHIDLMREITDNREVRSIVEPSGERRVIDDDAGAWWRESRGISLRVLGWVTAGVVVITVLLLRLFNLK